MALVAQAVFHGGFMLHAPGETHALGAMAVSHTLAAAATVAVALGAERAWWRLLDAALTHLLPRTSHPTVPPTLARVPSPAAPDGPVLRLVAAPRRTRGPRRSAPPSSRPERPWQQVTPRPSPARTARPPPGEPA
ncbi:hypothetical protein [Nocardioides zeae]